MQMDDYNPWFLRVFPDSSDRKIILLPVNLLPGITNDAKINVVHDERIQQGELIADKAKKIKKRGSSATRYQEGH